MLIRIETIVDSILEFSSLMEVPKHQGGAVLLYLTKRLSLD